MTHLRGSNSLSNLFYFLKLMIEALYFISYHISSITLHIKIDWTQKQKCLLSEIIQNDYLMTEASANSVRHVKNSTIKLDVLFPIVTENANQDIVRSLRRGTLRPEMPKIKHKC